MNSISVNLVILITVLRKENSKPSPSRHTKQPLALLKEFCDKRKFYYSKSEAEWNDSKKQSGYIATIKVMDRRTGSILGTYQGEIQTNKKKSQHSAAQAALQELDKLT